VYYIICIKIKLFFLKIGKQVTSLSLADNYILSMTANGQVYCWGQLDNDDTTQCRPVKCLINRQVNKIACNSNQVNIFLLNKN